MHIVAQGLGRTSGVVDLIHEVAVFNNHQGETGVSIVNRGSEMTCNGTAERTAVSIVGNAIDVEGQEARIAVNLRYILLDGRNRRIDTGDGAGFFSIAMETVDHHSGGIGAAASIVEECVLLICSAGKSIIAKSSVVNSPDGVSSLKSLFDTVVTAGAVTTTGTGELFKNASTGDTGRRIVNHGGNTLGVVSRGGIINAVGIGDSHRNSVVTCSSLCERNIVAETVS